MFGIDDLDAVYPDAKFVITHRDVTKVIPSVASVETAVVRMYTGTADPQYFGKHCEHAWDIGLRRFIALPRPRRRGPLLRHRVRRPAGRPDRERARPLRVAGRRPPAVDRRRDAGLVGREPERPRDAVAATATRRRSSGSTSTSCRNGSPTTPSGSPSPGRGAHADHRPHRRAVARAGPPRSPPRPTIPRCARACRCGSATTTPTRPSGSRASGWRRWPPNGTGPGTCSRPRGLTVGSLIMGGAGEPRPPEGSDGRTSVMGAGPFEMRCVEPFRRWTADYEGQALDTTVRRPGGADRRPVARGRRRPAPGDRDGRAAVRSRAP